ncbi:MAG: DUF58 domain-containing protein [Lentisphaerae bacterium]|jgi:hypothetical protein|nr:DUF58 domain-containing protein [Lentisphaerota bacterium]
MADTASILTIKERARQLCLRVRREVDGGLGGLYISRRRGFGLEFEELREYEIGDDARYLHWPTTLSQGRPYVKRYREDTKLDMMLCVDCSGSMHRLKGIWERGVEACAMLSCCAVYGGDGIGLLMGSDVRESYVPIGFGDRHWYRLVRQLLGCEVSGIQTDLCGLLRDANAVLRRGSRVVVVSDFLAGVEWEDEVRRLSRRHQLVLCQVRIDRYEELPGMGWVEVSDAEDGGRVLVDWSSVGGRSRRASDRADALDRVSRLCGELGGVHLVLDGTRRIDEVLQEAFSKSGKGNRPAKTKRS